jgi:hypothetical protein
MDAPVGSACPHDHDSQSREGRFRNVPHGDQDDLSPTLPSPVEVLVASNQQILVYNPMGYPPKVTGKALAPRLDTLDGKTVYLVDCRFDDSDIFLKQMQAWFADNMPSVNAVFKQISSVYTKDDPATWEEIKANGDAAIVGVGH